MEKKISPLPAPTQNLKGKKSRHAEPSHWMHEIFYFQNCSSPFLAWANTTIMN
jgi:hypothetical protein